MTDGQSDVWRFEAAVLEVLATDSRVAPVLAKVQQLASDHSGKLRGRQPTNPRNLAKSMTVAQAAPSACPPDLFPQAAVDSSMTAGDTIHEYYDSLRAGEPLAPFFAADDSLVKVGISERLVGYDEVAEGLRHQTETTEEWVVESADLRVTEQEGYAWFSDSVRMAWTDTETGTRHGFDSRWSGTLADRGGWVFVGMHVSAPRAIG